MVKVENLVKRFGNNYALNDISFEIGEGEIVGLLGPNGAGKSTTMNILTGYLSSTSGVVKIGGIDILENPIEAKRLIGFLPEQPPLYPEMTVIEFLNFVYELKGRKLPREEHIDSCLKEVKLGEVKNRLIGNLSKGNRQRVGIASVLIGDPKVVIFDEPTVGLDPKQVLSVRNLLRSLAKKHTVILSTHILSEVQAVCERVIIINKGEIIADERTADIVKTIEDGYRYKVKICAPEKTAAAAIRSLHGVKSLEETGERDGDSYVFIIETAVGVDVRKPLFNLCAKNMWHIIGLEPYGTDLESIFIRLVDRSEGITAEGGSSKRRTRKKKEAK